MLALNLFGGQWAPGLPRWCRGNDPPAKQEKQETRVRSLGQDDPWVEMIPGRRAWPPTPVSLPGESHWAGEPGSLRSTGSQRVEHNWVMEHRDPHIQFPITYFKDNFKYDAKWKEKKRNEFLFFSLENKENSEQAWTFLVFYLTASTLCVCN